MSSIGKPLSHNTRDNEQNKFKEDTNGNVAVNICGEVSLVGGNESSSNNLEFGVSGESISAVKAIYSDGNAIFLANNNLTVSESSVIGLTRNAVSGVGENVSYQFQGTMYDSTFNFPVNDLIYLDVNGNITNIAPTTGFLTVIGTSLGQGSIRININNPISL